MRRIVYDNLLELIKENDVDYKKTKYGAMFILSGKDGAEVFSLYSNNRKIELFVNHKLFASATREPDCIYDQNHEHNFQLRYIKRMLEERSYARRSPVTLKPYVQNNSVKHRNHFGATPAQTLALQSAWLRSYKLNHELYSLLGNSR